MPETPRDDGYFMARALQLASRGLGRTSPNPAVGAVVVRDGRIVGEGWHQKAGEPHAEPIALIDAGPLARGADIYVTLEPCSHWGRTPPCTAAIIDAGISRVVYACDDCDERCAGQAARSLHEAGVAVQCGPLGEEARRLNEAYFKHKRTGLPFVTLKMAATLDGKIATRTGDSRWVSCELSRRRVHQMRNRMDAVMVGVGTVLSDDPLLTTRLDEPGARNPLRIVVDSQAKTPPSARVIGRGTARGDTHPPCLIAVAEGAESYRRQALREAGAEVLEVPPDAAGRVDIPALMKLLGDRGILSILLEGGPTLASAFVQAQMADKLVVFYAPKLVGGANAPTILEGTGVAAMSDALPVDVQQVERVGVDVMIEGYLGTRDADPT